MYVTTGGVRASQARQGDRDALKQFKESAERCRTPRQFRALVNRLRAILPYQHFICAWGYLPDFALGFIYTHHPPTTDFLQWFLTKGMVRKGPLLQEWFRTKRVQIFADVARRHADTFVQGHREKIVEAGLQHSLAGGQIGKGLFVFCTVSLASEEACRAGLKPFHLVLPCLCKALTQACPRPLLTARETAIVQRRLMGEAIKHIAAEEGIAQRTVTMHLQRIKKKLYTDDLVNAVVIAVKSFHVDEARNERCWPRDHGHS